MNFRQSLIVALVAGFLALATANPVLAQSEKAYGSLPPTCWYPGESAQCDTVPGWPVTDAWCEIVPNDRTFIDTRPVQWQAVGSGDYLIAYGFANGWAAATRQCNKALAQWRPPG